LHVFNPLPPHSGQPAFLSNSAISCPFGVISNGC
jgi:hypothetical protein